MPALLTCEMRAVFLDTSGDAAVDWDEIVEILEDASRLVAPASAVAQLDRR